MQEMEELWRLLQAELERWGADCSGVADLLGCREAVRRDYGEDLTAWPRAVSFGVALPRMVVNELADAPTKAYLTYYDAANARLDDIAMRLCRRLDREGYDAYPIPASVMMGENKLCGRFSHRWVARLAGLGWIGRSCSLISPEFGPRLRLCTVLTRAMLPAGSPIAERCHDCGKCAESCPAGALKGRDFAADEDISARFDGAACQAYLKEMRQVFGKQICGRCLAACPWGKHAAKTEKKNGGKADGGAAF